MTLLEKYIAKVDKDFDEKFPPAYFAKAQAGFFSERNGYSQPRELKDFIQSLLPELIKEVCDNFKELESITKCVNYGCDNFGTITNGKGEPEPCECCDTRKKILASLAEPNIK